jgi:hypothetical protein
VIDRGDAALMMKFAHRCRSAFRSVRWLASEVVKPASVYPTTLPWQRCDGEVACATASRILSSGQDCQSAGLIRTAVCLIESIDLTGDGQCGDRWNDGQTRGRIDRGGTSSLRDRR